MNLYEREQAHAFRIQELERALAISETVRRFFTSRAIELEIELLNMMGRSSEVCNIRIKELEVPGFRGEVARVGYRDILAPSTSDTTE